jgi:deoxycytidine triphosphate deaminase
MELHALLEEQRRLQTRITRVISALVEEFKKETGVSPCSIDIRLHDVTSTGDKTRQYAVGATKVDLALESVSS